MGAIKNIFREVSPEATDFSFYFDDDGIKEAGGDFCYNLFIVTREGLGRMYGFQIEEYRRITEKIRELSEDFETVPGEYFPSYKAAMEYHGIRYSPNRCKALKDLLLSEDLDDSDPETVAAYLTITTGRPWDVASATGYSQGDYCEIVYCKDFHENPRAYGEIWLGAGREFEYIALDDDGNEIERVGGYIIADCQAWKDEEYKRLLCEWEGCKPEETAIEMIDDWSTHTEYTYRTA